MDPTLYPCTTITEHEYLLYYRGELTEKQFIFSPLTKFDKNVLESVLYKIPILLSEKINSKLVLKSGFLYLVTWR